jgi:hypothetical protein
VAALLGVGEYRGDTVPMPPRIGAPAAPRAAGEPTVLFLNFDGATLVAGNEDSRANVTTIGMLAGEYEPYGDDDAKREAVMQAVQDDWYPYNVTITDGRPDSGDYVMCMVGPSDVYPSSTLGIAPLDCGNRGTQNNVTFAFHSADDSHGAAATATTISQEIAHAFGLEHVSDPDDIMNPYNVGGDPTFTDDCLSVVDEPECSDQHVRSCDASSKQSSHRELLDLIGPRKPDEDGPGIEFESPEDGDEFAEDEAFDIVVLPDEELDVAQMDLFVDGSWVDSDDAPPYGWSVSDVAAGSYELYVEAVETDGRRVSTEVITVHVGVSPTTDIDEPLPPNYGTGQRGPACECTSGRERSLLAWQILAAILFVLGGFKRPFRRAGAPRLR